MTKIGPYNLSKEKAILFIPFSYCYRCEINFSNYQKGQKYIFFFRSIKLTEKNNRIWVFGKVLDRNFVVIHTSKFKKFFTAGKTIPLCGEITLDLECFFPDLFDLRVGWVPKYKNLGMISVKKLHKLLEETELWPYLLKIHQPKSLEDINYGFQKMLEIELSCLLKQIENTSTEKIPLKFNENYNIDLVLSPSQEMAIKNIFMDLKSNNTVTRLIYGDVGSGKTIVALIASLKVTENEKNVLFLLPTILLASQVFEYYKKYASGYNFVLVGSKTVTLNQKGTIFIGTHKLLWKEFNNVGLVIIDEQHKFGVCQRNRISSHQCDVIMMTATFIPRTMQMMIAKYFPLSRLESFNEKKIETLIVHKSEKVDLLEGLVNQNLKFALILRSIKLAESYYDIWKEKYNCFLLHSKIKNKTDVLKNFDNCEFAILFTTTVFEVGIDIDLNLMVIEESDMFGLAQLHQLRGRLGRRGKNAICILIGENIKKLQDIQHAKDGFEISKLDLSKRGFGMLHSTLQSGFENFVFNKFVNEKGEIQKAEITEFNWYQAKAIEPSEYIKSVFFTEIST